MYWYSSEEIPDNIYPARGRKRKFRSALISVNSQFPTIFTPQGDGNRIWICCQTLARKFPTIFTPQGDGNLCTNSGTPCLIRMIPDNIYPARGRKHAFRPRTHDRASINSRQYLPRKGTETLPIAESPPITVSSFPTIFTPQGDGNVSIEILSSSFNG